MDNAFAFPNVAWFIQPALFRPPSCYFLRMKTKQLTKALARVETLLPEAQNELAELALELEAGVSGGAYKPTPDELAGIDRGLLAASNGRFASEQQVGAAFARFLSQ